MSSTPPKFYRRWPLTAAVTLFAQLWGSLAPTIAFAQEEIDSEVIEMVPLSDYSRVDGGGLSTAGDRTSAAFESKEQDDGPQAANGQGFEDVAGRAQGDQNGESSEADREGENAGTDQTEQPLPGEEPTSTLALPGGEDKTGVTAQKISVPKGAGSIKGMEESFSAQLSTGIATFSVPFSLMAGRGGASPSLGLSYSSAGGAGPAGQGWSVGVPFVARQTDKGLPRYLDGCNETTAPGYECEHPNAWHPNQDRFVYNGGQELVPICTVVDGDCDGALTVADGAPRDEVMPDWADGYQYFRPRVEGSFLRFFWAPDHESWIVQDKSGAIMELGTVNGNGPAPGGLRLEGAPGVRGNASPIERNPGRTHEMFKWHLSRQYDQHVDGATGQVPLNLVAYGYRQSGGQAYLEDIYDTSPYEDPETTNHSTFAHHTVLRWEVRPDRTESYRSGWLMSSELRLVGVDVASKTYMGGAEEPRRQVRRYHLAYDDELHRSVLRSVQVEGRCGGSENDAATPTESDESLPASTGCGRLPAMEFGYSEVEGYETDGERTDAAIEGYMPFDARVASLPGSPQHSIDEELTDFFDINHDGLPDVLVTAPGLYSDGHAVFENGVDGVAGYGPFQNMSVQGKLGATPNTLTLRNLNVSPQDVDGDGAINLLHMPRHKEYAVYDARKQADGYAWVGREIHTANDQDVKVDFSQDAAFTQVMDVNFDGLVDIVVSTGTEYQTFYSLGRYPGGDGQFGQAQMTGAMSAEFDLNPVTSCVPHAGLPIQFNERETKLADMNGDGITDIVRLRRGNVRYWPGRGNGFWGTGDRADCVAGNFGSERHKEMLDAPRYSDIEGSTIRLNDVNGDGLSDLVQINFGSVDVWLNVDGQGWTEKYKIGGTPYHAGFHNRVRLLDANGSGTPDILWGDAEDYKYLDLQGGVKPYMLTEVRNGLGKRTLLEYSTSTNEMLATASGAVCGTTNDPWGEQWCSKMPSVTHVVKQVSETVVDPASFTVRGQVAPTYVTRYDYRDPVYEGRQREFRGFARAKVTRIGDVNSPTDVSESVFLLGQCRDPVNGSFWDGEDLSHFCAPPNRWADNPYEALKGLPIETHKMDDAGRHLASTENAYVIRDLYRGRDGRRVRHAYLNGADSLLYDTASEHSARVAIERRGFRDLDSGVLSEDPEAEVHYEPGMARLRTANEVDLFGNQTVVYNYGCVAGGACSQNHGLRPDETIEKYSVAELQTQHGGGWMWRSVRNWVSGSYSQAAHTARRGEGETTFDHMGRPIESRAFLSGATELERRDESTKPHESTVAQNHPGGFVVSRTRYDAFGLATRTRSVNGRCSEVAYDPHYGLFASRESVSVTGDPDESAVPAATVPCVVEDDEGELLTTSATYDHGYGAVVTAMDLNLRNTLAVYDEFGRLSALHKPSAYKQGAESTYQTHPSVQIEYYLPGDLDGANHSIIHTQTQDGTDEDDIARQMHSYAYVDGFGRTIVTLGEGDPTQGQGQGNDGGGWVVGSLLEWDQKSAVSKKYMPFFWDGDPMDFDYASQPTTAYGRQRYDAFGRQVQTFDLDGTITLQSQYHALSTDLWDAADIYPGAHQGSYASERKDGHGRTVQTTERFRALGQMEERHIQTTYLPSGEPLTIKRVRGDEAVLRFMQYDSLGRMVLNAEPNASTGWTQTTDSVEYQTYEPGDVQPQDGLFHAWRYQYNLAGDLMGTSDARGCGQNFFYDSAGRIVGEDYAPCEATQEEYTDPRDAEGALTDLNALEVAYFYDGASTLPESFAAEAPTDWMAAATPVSGFTVGRPIAVFDRGSATFTTYDGRGRTVLTHTRIATPTIYASDGLPFERPQRKQMTARYATRVYSREFEFDAANRQVKAETGADHLLNGEGEPAVPELLSEEGESYCSTAYSARGSVKESSSSYGSLVSSITRTADSLVTDVVYGDAAQTRTAYLYDERRRISSVQTYRGPPASGAWEPSNESSTGLDAEEPTRQLVLQDEDYEYDVVGNPVEIRDWRDPQDWPAGAKPVTKKIEYDDLYRATRIQYQYAEGDDEWKSPFQAELEADSDQNDRRRAEPSPHIKFAKRILEQTYEYDWVGNNRKTTDDADGFYDRSLGDVDGGPGAGLDDKPYQLKHAALGGSRLDARYDAAGYMSAMALVRTGTCLRAGHGTEGELSNFCNQQFRYEWDEVGRLARARRWDNDDSTAVDAFDPALTTATLAADLRYTYDASDMRVIKHAHDWNIDVAAEDRDSFTLYIFETLELRRARHGENYDDGLIDEVHDYEVNAETVVPYLLANGVRIARLVYHGTGAVPEEDYSGVGAPGDVNGPIESNGQLHVFFELGDHLGSTSVVLDKATGELVERAMYQGYGGAESDYRPGRWKSFREDYRFTGKEADVEVGLRYFGKRYLNPLLGRWISADPLEVHGPLSSGEPNAYSYISGTVLMNVDPIGLSALGGNGPGPGESYPSGPRPEPSASVAVEMRTHATNGHKDVHGTNMNQFLANTHSREVGAETRTTISRTGSDTDGIIADLSRAAEALANVEAKEKVIELTGHSNSTQFTREVVITRQRGEEDSYALVGGLTQSDLRDVENYRRGLPQYLKEVKKAKADGSFQLIEETEANLKKYYSDHKVAKALSEDFAVLAKKLQAAGVTRVNLQSCDGTKSVDPGATSGSMQYLLKRALSITGPDLKSYVHEVNVGAHSQGLWTHGSHAVSVGRDGTQHDTRLPAPQNVK